MNTLKRFRSTAWLAIPVGLIALIAVLLAATPAAAEGDGAAPLTLRNHVTLTGEAVRLGDIFDGFERPRAGVSGDTVVAYTPQPGRRAIFDANWLSRIAQRHQLNWRPATRLDRVVVERASTVVDAEDIATALRDELAARGAAENIELELSNRSLLVHIDSEMPPTVEVVHMSTEPRRGKFSAIVAVPAGDPLARRVTVTGQLHSMVEVPVPTRPLRPGDIIRDRDIGWQRVRANTVQSGVVTDAQAFVGREPKRPLSANKMVRRSDLRVPVTVSKGMLVTMTFSTSAMVLTTSGRALEAGSVGDFISVRNTQTNATVDARILGPNRVEVAPLNQLAASGGQAQ